ncbi:hypothetical protein AN396_11940 [Candidatus Epulonipiscium fishelsonii]|uniref:Uncharacterized protein n=1 Tax=Candidatus Epulonipiscium fishelsonii TaxID=77094 RepID=A0ACC8X7Z5_9FIRM|nr:hypothetical protein AN396_11940 [Epulopiscium sp. SCG-B11WGA-EpuloA1]
MPPQNSVIEKGGWRMAIPLVVLGIAGLVGTAGVGTGIKGKIDNDKATSIQHQADTITSVLDSKLEDQLNYTLDSLVKLGENKIDIYNDELQNFVKAYEKIQSINYETDKLNFSEQDFEEIKELATYSHDATVLDDEFTDEEMSAYESDMILIGISGFENTLRFAEDLGQLLNIAEEEPTQFSEEVDIVEEEVEVVEEKVAVAEKKTSKFFSNVGTMFGKAKDKTTELLETSGVSETFEQVADTSVNFFDKAKDKTTELLETSGIFSEEVATMGAAATAGIVGGAGMAGGTMAVASAVGTAGTGTAIASLSGAAANSAALAWLGGGTLAAGGAGIAGGTIALGAMSAPAVALGAGIVYAIDADKNLKNAEESLVSVEGYEDQINTACDQLKDLEVRANEIKLLMNVYSKEFNQSLDDLTDLIDKKSNWKDYSEDEKFVVAEAFEHAQTMKSIIDTPIIDDTGKLTLASEKLLQK